MQNDVASPGSIKREANIIRFGKLPILRLPKVPSVLRLPSSPSLAAVSFLVLFTLGFLDILIPPLRHGKYLIAAILLLVPLLARSFPRVMVDVSSFKTVSKYLWLYLVMVLYSSAMLLWRGNVSVRFLSEAFFLLCPPVVAMLILGFTKRQELGFWLKAFFLGTILVYIGDKGLSSVLGYVAQFSAFFKLSNSYLDSESQLAFIFGLFLIFFAYQRKWGWALMAAIFTIFAYKRIAILAALGGLIVLLALSRFKNPPIKPQIILAIVLATLNTLVVGFYYQVVSGSLDDLVHSTLGISTNLLLMGRQEIYARAFMHVPSTLIGNGLGSTTEVLRALGSLDILHSDVLKVFLEFGPMVFWLWMFVYYRIAADSVIGLALTVYLNVLFLTDNTLIYFQVMVPFYLLLHAAQHLPLHGVRVQEGCVLTSGLRERRRTALEQRGDSQDGLKGMEA